MFNKCIDAINYANTSKTYGAFHSLLHDANRDIHLHECCEILFCLSGGKSFFIGDKIYEVNPNDVFVINPFEAHKITSEPTSDFERFVLHVHPSFLYGTSTTDTDLGYCFDYRNAKISIRLLIFRCYRLQSPPLSLRKMFLIAA